ncbi:MAG: hypothetical protein JXB49_03285 [Bacteroidales bacterium]|nr:hypothetical protein [Bacteroidales bacterium]
MDRKHFIKKVCTAGVCGCAAMTTLTSFTAGAKTSETSKDEPDWKIGFVQKRMAKLMGILDQKLDKETTEEVLEMLGRECANESIDKHFTKYKGNIQGFFDAIKEWGDEASYDEENGIIRIKGKKMDSCFCPFVDKNLMSTDFCNCSLGWQKQLYETLLDKKVDVTIDSSVLRGGDSCCFSIKIL